MAETPETETTPAPAPLSKEDATMAAIDNALAPIHASTELGPIHHGDLKRAALAFRQALAALVYGPPEVPEPGESRDMLREQRIAARNASIGLAEPVFSPEHTEPVVDPLAEEPEPKQVKLFS